MKYSYPSWERISRRVLVDTSFMRVYEDSLALPNGNIIDDYTVVNMPNGVVIVATDCDGNLIVQYEYKYAIDKTILTLPSGGIDEGESTLVAAKRELLEETGYESDEIEVVRTLYEYPSKADHLIYIIRAKNAKKITEATHEFTENISPVILLSPNDKDYEGVFDTTYNVSAIALTLPNFLKKN
jgi:8-oxo-dGTP pyrophosphatase MutT (NUDIX family)